MEVDSEIPRPDAYVGSLVDTIRDGIHTRKANQMSNETLLSLIEVAIASEVLEATEDTNNGAQAAQAAGQALHAGSSADVPSAKRGATAKPNNKRKTR